DAAGDGAVELGVAELARVGPEQGHGSAGADTDSPGPQGKAGAGIRHRAPVGAARGRPAATRRGPCHAARDSGSDGPSDILPAVDLRETADDRTFREEVRTFLEESLSGDFAVTR